MLSRIENFRPDEVDVALELIDDAIARPDASGYHALVAHDDADGALLGYICYGPTPMTVHTVDLYWIAVDTALQNRGTGRRLLEDFEDRVRAQGARVVRLETSSQEAYGATLAFYERTGFLLGGRIPHFYREDDDLLMFYKTL